MAASVRISPTGIIPALAGSISLPRSTTCKPTDHPRTRGEHAVNADAKLRKQGSSPHSRGAWFQLPKGVAESRIIPALAGSITPCILHKDTQKDHPRTRGEHPVRLDQSAAKPGSSPHSRGASPDRRCTLTVDGIIPALAGSIARSALHAHRRRDHPRTRGEHTTKLEALLANAGSSPHSRGALDSYPV